MDYVANGELFNVVAANLLSEEHVRYIIYQIAQTLAFLHSRRIIHRDLKLENVLVDRVVDERILQGACDFRHAALKRVSPPCLKLLKRLLNPDPAKRATIADVLNSKWLS
uniref:Serine/threonine-protein kinase SAPK2-like n=1 Tax=Dermatophagoides pteronyssinus TaxID=6956 RepID=A0A6P6Y4N7_DERPT